MTKHVVSGTVGQAEITIETGGMAAQASGAVVIKLGGTEVLVTAVSQPKLREGVGFFPLTVDVEERMYAAGRIPGSFFRREGRATERAILTCRLIDRPLRPSFIKGFRCDTHVIATIMGVDDANAYDILALNGASAALSASNIPFLGPVGAVRMALKDGEWIAFPTYDDLDESVFELVVAGSRNADGEVDIVMVEAGSTTEGIRLIEAGQQASDEATVARGLDESKFYIGQMVDMQAELASKVEIDEVEWPVVTDYSDEVYSKIEAVATKQLASVMGIVGKKDRAVAEKAARVATFAAAGFDADDADPAEVAEAKNAFRAVSKKMIRNRVIEEGIRMDGRGLRDVRAVKAEVGVIGQAHGSGLFQRGETQVLNVTTLGMLKMAAMLDTLDRESSKRYMHHYNFPPYSTGETGFMRGPKRREIGHGALAEKALLPVIPSEEDFPYAYRLVSEVLASNGSSSMASVCGSSLSLMDAGVPIAAPVAGIAMGLINEGDKFVTITDILGAEDALGDMDFKVAGTADVITALQLDTKISGLPSSVLGEALEQAKEARLEILGVMAQAIDAPRPELNKNAPRIVTVLIPKDKIGEVIGPKGKHIRELEEETGAMLEIDEDGVNGIVRIAATSGDSLDAAVARVNLIANPPEAEIGEVYEGQVVSVMPFGAFINILPGRDGLLHISKIDKDRRVERVEDYLNLGDKVQVKVEDIDRSGKLSLVPAEKLEGPPEGEGGSSRPSGGDRDRGGERNRGGGDRNRSGGNRDRNRGGDRNRDRDGGNRDSSRGGNDRSEKSEDTNKPGRRTASFEDQFE